MMLSVLWKGHVRVQRLQKNIDQVLSKWLLNSSENGDRSSQMPQKVLYCFCCWIFNGKFSNQED